jgi:hypothetical protein
MDFKVGDKVVIYGFTGTIKEINNGNLLVKVPKEGMMNCNYVYAKLVEENERTNPDD